jgi:shikimate kinase
MKSFVDAVRFMGSGVGKSYQIQNKKIIITGNIGSGKTTIGKELAKRMNVEFIELDEYRRKHNKKSDQAGEDRARELFFRRIESKQIQIIELTGSGKVYQELLQKLGSTEKYIIRLDCDEKILLERMVKRVKSKYVFPPLPKTWGMNSSLHSLTEGIVWMSKNISVKSDLVLSTEVISAKVIAKSIVENIYERFL